MATAVNETAVAVPESGQAIQPAVRRKDLQGYLESPAFKTQVQMALPPEITADTFVRAAATALLRTPKLIQCSQTSFFQAALDLASYGLLPNGRDAHLIPYDNGKVCQCGHSGGEEKYQNKHERGFGKCTVPGCGCTKFGKSTDAQLIIDYKGLAKCVRRSGEISYIHADAVYEKDNFSFEYGSNAHLRHSWPENGERGTTIRAFYSYVKLRDGSEDFIVFSKGQVDAVRGRSKSANSGPWQSDYAEMGKKTVFRNHSKWLPFSEKVREVIERDDEFTGTVDMGGAFEAAANRDAIEASISLTDVKPSTDPNRGHDATAPVSEAPVVGEVIHAKPELKHLGSKNGIPVFSDKPPVATMSHGQKVYVRKDGVEQLYFFDGALKNDDGTEGAFIIPEE